MTEESVDWALTNDNTALSDRMAFAESVVFDETESPSLRAKAACWRTYRALEASDYDEKFCNVAFSVIGNETNEKARLRWKRSLMMAWCYIKIGQGADVRGYLWQINDWNGLKYEASSALNMARAMLLFACFEAAAKGPVVPLAVDYLHNICRIAAVQLNFSKAPDVAGFEYEALARVVRIAVSLRPYLGLDFTGVTVPIDQIVAIETDRFFRDALKTTLKRLVQQT